jgi:peptide/nickel transport system substrate-binding protein
MIQHIAVMKLIALRHLPSPTGLLLILLTLLAPACGSQPAGEREIGYGLTLSPTGIDPHINASVELGIPLSSVYDTLVFQNPDTLEFVPGLATAWEISSDDRIYRFELRRDVSFHDGTQFNAEAVKANIGYILDPANRSQKAAGMLGPLSEIRVVDEFTVEFVLETPFAPMLDSLSQVYLGMASPTALARWGGSDYQFNQVGTGPYRFVEYLPDDHLTLERNPDYDWGPSFIQNRTAQIDRIVFRFYEDLATRGLALESGRVSVIGEVPVADAERLSMQDQFVLYPIEIPGQPLQYFFHTGKAPTDDRLVRQALVLAINRERIVNTVFGRYSPVASGPLSANTFGYSAEYAFPEPDSGRAVELLQQAGWTLKEGLWEKAGEVLKLNVVVPSWGMNPEVGQLLESEWRKLGLEIDLQVLAGFGPLLEAQSAGNYHVIGFNSFGTDPDLLRSFFSSEGFFNWSHLESEQADDILLRASQANPDRQIRQELYAEISRLVRDEWLILPVRDYVNLVVANEQLRNLRFSPQGWFPYLIELELAP